jgi:hypothetical protein
MMLTSNYKLELILEGRTLEGLWQFEITSSETVIYDDTERRLELTGWIHVPNDRIYGSVVDDFVATLLIPAASPLGQELIARNLVSHQEDLG